MPRRTKAYIGPGKTLVNGGRVAEDENGPVTVLQEVDLDTASDRKKVAAHIEKFDELGQLEDREQFIQDLVHECGRAQSLGLCYLVRGTHTKPVEWTTQILVRGLATVMRRHGLEPAISEYFDKDHNKRQSLYLRLIPGLIWIARLPPIADVKGLALRAKRIKHET
jgi:hypothetical protein